MGLSYFNSCFYFDLPPSFLCLGHIDGREHFFVLMHESLINWCPRKALGKNMNAL